MKELAALILKVSEEADTEWNIHLNMAGLINKHCPDSPAGHLTSILLITAWNDAIGWAKANA